MNQSSYSEKFKKSRRKLENSKKKLEKDENTGLGKEKTRENNQPLNR